MSRLRPHLHSAREAYRHLHYPGDLAAEILDESRLNRTSRPSRRLLSFGFGGGALAAGVALAVMLSRPALPALPPGRPAVIAPQPPHPGAVARATAKGELPLAPPAMPEVAAMPAMPDWSSAPAMPSVPAMPALPAMPSLRLAYSVPARQGGRPAVLPISVPGWLSPPSAPPTAPPSGEGSPRRENRTSKEPT